MAKDSAGPSPPKKRKHPAPLTYENRVRLAKELLQNHPVIWNRKHPKFHTNSARDTAWTVVASKLRFDLEATRKEWKRFMNMHFTRQQRVSRGDAPAKTTQLHRLLDGLFPKESDSEEVVEVTVRGLQCALCLRWTSNGELFEMFEDICGVVPKVRTVLGVYFCEKSVEGRKICTLCRELVELMEEFRTLCQLTNELGQERVRIQVLDSADAVGWRSCASKIAKVCDSVRLQQRLVDRAMKQDAEEPVGIKLEVEEEGDRKEEEDRLKLSPVEVKKEEESSSDEEDSSDDEDSTESESEDDNTLYEVFKVVDGDDEPVKIKSEPEDNDAVVIEPDKPSTPPSHHKFTAADRLRFAQACLSHPIIWNHRDLPKNPTNSKTDARNAAWDAIGTEFDITRDQAKLEYKRLRNIHAGRGTRLASGELRPDDYLIVDPLFGVLCKMMGVPAAVVKEITGKDKARKSTDKQPKRRQQRVRTNGERKERHRMDYEWSLRFAKEVDKLEPFWNVSHADHTRPTMTKLLSSLATTMQCDVATVRREWKRFGEMHRRKLVGQARGRKSRTINANASDDPLQPLLDKFFAYKTLEGGGRLKSRFDSEGCVAREQRGVIRYVKVCEECGKHVERSVFEAHMNRHRGVKPYGCRFCEGRYTTRVNRDRHENIYHTREGFDIECDACGERFRHKSSLAFHYAVRHKSANVPCGICQKVFKHDRHLDFHMQKQHSVKLTNYRKSMAAKAVKG
uniref:Endothelial zinc finger protein induced by tumor necrosis factor alpha n=1 Tax=Culex pipiens TaxID=7175 RepID=A0A8D8CEV5_CULPI